MVGIRRNRLGSASLLAAVAGFLFVELQPWIPLASIALFGGLSLKGLLRAFFEASLAGAFADWFAVTALFKDPLGIRLPHTNILAKNKDSIAAAIPHFLTGFVSPAAIAEELGKIDYASKMAEALEAGGAREEVHAFLRLRAAGLLSAYGGGDEAKSQALRRFVDQIFGFISERVDAPAEVSGLLAWARKERFDERALEGLAEYARTEIGRNRARLVAIMTPIVKRSAGWQGLFIGPATMERFLAGLQEELAEVRTDSTNDLRRFILSSIGDWAAKLASPGPEREALALTIRDALASEDFRSIFAQFAGQVLSRIGDDLSGEDGSFFPSLERAEEALAARLSGDTALRAALNGVVASLLASVLERGRVVEGVTEYLAGLLRATDERIFVSKIEGSVWNDLQYIRLNGAVVGGFVGLAITTVKAALGG